jgi:hypothetical protein
MRQEEVILPRSLQNSFFMNEKTSVFHKRIYLTNKLGFLLKPYLPQNSPKLRKPGSHSDEEVNKKN